ncbi:alpha/beta fold hydrolase [Streptomyces sp. NPDC051776]|uniref:thioesterase II family protein n=1 Tax=Streptomyces sp. NPDC051776 TaxID=3155414 RepID=UPI003414D350
MAGGNVSAGRPPAPAVPRPGRLGPWLRCWAPRPSAGIRLICLPHAGGSAGFYRPWASLMPPQVELLALQYPGREERYSEPMIDRMETLVTAATDALEPILDRPYALFGHSMGSAVAWELAGNLRALGLPAPKRLLVSGRAAPGAAPAGALHRGDDDALCTELRRLGGTHQEVLSDPELRDAVLGCVRNDYRLIETHRPRARPQLDSPIAVFTGDADTEFDTRSFPDRTGGWSALTTSRTRVHTFSGDHFYLVPQRDRVVAAVLRALDPSLAAGPWPSTP